MVKLVVYLTTEQRIRQCEQADNPFEVDINWMDAAQAEIYGRVWARVWPSDIVMLMED